MKLMPLVTVLGLVALSVPAFAAAPQLGTSGQGFSSPAPAKGAAQAGPSLQDTLSWMDYTYNPHVSSGSFGHGIKEIYDGGGANYFSRINESFSYRGCQMTLVIEDDPNSTLLGVHSRATHTFDLRDIDPKSIETRVFDSHQNGEECRDPEVARALHMSCDSAEITFGTRNGNKVISVVTEAVNAPDKKGGNPNTNTTKSMEANSLFEVNNPDYAQRFARALSHAIDLCVRGGQ